MIDKMLETLLLFVLCCLGMFLITHLIDVAFNPGTDCLHYSLVTGKKTMYVNGECYEYVNDTFKVVNFKELLK